MATVDVRFAALPVHVRTARLITTAVARRCGIAEELLDEVRLAVGEACARAVGVHQVHVPAAPVQLLLTDDADGFAVTVLDEAPPGAGDPTPGERLVDDAVSPLPDDPASEGGQGGEGGEGGEGQDGTSPQLAPPGIGLAVIAGLVDDVEVAERAEGRGTRIVMRWSLPGPEA